MKMIMKYLMDVHHQCPDITGRHLYLNMLVIISSLQVTTRKVRALIIWIQSWICIGHPSQSHKEGGQILYGGEVTILQQITYRISINWCTIKKMMNFYTTRSTWIQRRFSRMDQVLPLLVRKQKMTRKCTLMVRRLRFIFSEGYFFIFSEQKACYNRLSAKQYQMKKYVKGI